MENLLEELIKMSNPKKDWLDIIYSLSTLILSLAAFLITSIITIKQWVLAKYEYKYKLSFERYEIFKLFNEVLIGLKYHDREEESKLLEIENKLFIFNDSIINTFDEMKTLIMTTDKTSSNYKKQEYTENLSNIINSIMIEMKKLLIKLYKNK